MQIRRNIKQNQDVLIHMTLRSLLITYCDKNVIVSNDFKNVFDILICIKLIFFSKIKIKLNYKCFLISNFQLDYKFDQL